MYWTDFDTNYSTFITRVFNMFQINVEDLISNKFQLLIHETNLKPHETDKLYYWEYEMYIKMLNKHNKDVNENNEAQSNDQMGKYNLGNFNPSSLMNKVPKLPKF